MKTSFFRFILSVLLCGVLTSVANAADMADLTSLLSKFDTYKAAFTQQSFEQGGEELQSLKGVMILQRPDHFYWESEAPFEQKLVSNGKSIWHFDADLEQVVIQEFSKQADQAPILVVLRDPQKLDKTYRLLKSEKKKGQRVFHLEAIDKKAVIRSVEIGFSESVLSSLVFVDHLQQKTAMQFTSPVINEKFEASTFEFILPDGVDVLYE